MIFCSNKTVNVNMIPLPIPIIVIIVLMVYPKQNPLYNIIPNTIGIPYNCSPKKP